MLNRIKKILYQIRLSIAKKGPYRFLIKKWHFMGDINLASHVISTEFFRDSLEPIELPIDKFKKYVVLAPHQDDETIGAGGLLALLKDQKAQVHVIFMSNGSQDIPGFSVNEVVELRAKEAKKAMELVNATIHNLTIDDLSVDVNANHVKELSRMIQEISPDVILLPWLLDSPAKHRMTNHLLWLADKISPIKTAEVWSYQVHNTIYSNTYVDITSKIGIKKQMIECYKSQNDHYRSYTHICMGMAAWNSRFISEHSDKIQERYVELFFALPIQDYLKLISDYYFTSFHETYKGRTMIMKAMKKLNEEIVKK